MKQHLIEELSVGDARLKLSRGAMDDAEAAHMLNRERQSQEEPQAPVPEETEAERMTRLQKEHAEREDALYYSA